MSDDIEKPNKKTPRRIVDVAKPGDSAPAATSKPVIVTNRPLLRDPMMAPKAAEKPGNDEEKEDEAPETTSQTTLKTSDKQVIQPLDPTLSEESDETTEAVSPEQEKPAEADTTASIQDGKAETLPAKDAGMDETIPEGNPTSTPDNTPTDTTPSEPPASDTSQNSTLKQDEAAEAAAEARHDADVRQLIDSKQYVLPINTIEKRKSRRFVLLGVGLAVVLIIIWLDIALDAGIIRLGGIKPLTHFFSN